MPVSQGESTLKKMTYYTPSSSSRKFHVIRRKKTSPSNHKKSSVEDLVEQGFFIGRTLGEGSYCKVRAATYQGKEIAVKIIIRSEISLDFESRFLPREIDVLSKVNHPNIIKVYKIFSYPRKVYIFMEFVKRGDLLAYIRSRGRLVEQDARHYFRQMVAAMQYLHGLNIAHRDLKCENIMIDEGDIIKIIDFGFCRSTVNKKGRRELSRTFCGSTAYAAPEVLQGIPYNPMMYDVWSLGCVLFIMMTGTMPFDDSNVRRMVTCQLKRQFKYPSTFRINREVRNIITHMLEPDVTRRANMNQVSRYPWLQEDEEDEISSDPGLNTVSRQDSVSMGTQTHAPIEDWSNSEDFDVRCRRGCRKNDE